MQDDLFDFDKPQSVTEGVPESVTESVPDYEKSSYGKTGYKRIQRLRRKGHRRGIEVPQLGFELTKPEKPRTAFLIAGIVVVVLFIGILVGAGFLIKYFIEMFSDTFKESGGFMETLTNPSVFIATAGLSALAVLFLILAYLLALMILVIPIILAFYCFSFALNTFYMARCSKEEFAKGELIRGRIFNFICVLAVATVILILGLASFETQKIKILLGLIYAGIVIIFGGFLVLMLVERAKCNKWFEGLDEYKKRNFIEHNKALRRVKRRMRTERNLWNF